MTHFAPIPDFDSQSYSTTCPITHEAKQKGGLGKQEHEVDEFILRGPEITAMLGGHETTLGFFDVRPEAIREAAFTHLGMVDGSELQDALFNAQETDDALEGALVEITSLRDQVAALTIGNAEQVVQIAALETVLEEMYEEPETGDDMLDQESLFSLEELAELEEAVEG